MRTLLNNALVASVSVLTTTLLFVACTVERPGASPTLSPTSRPAVPSAAPAGSTADPAGAGAQRGADPTAAPAPDAAKEAPAPLTRVASAQVAAQPAQGGATPAVQVYQRNGASVVNVTSVALVRGRLGVAEQPQGVGSGFILDAEGRIVTNNHVVEDADQLTVTFRDRTSVKATLLGRDPDNDLAVIQVDAAAADDEGQPIRARLRPVVLGDSDQIAIGEVAIAIGSPLGLQQTVTAGIVSAIRTPGEEAAGGQLDLLGGAIQTDAAINPGNSGGPLFNAAGEVVGVNTAILSQSGGNIGIGFAIPINVAKRVAPELIQFGRYRHPYIGVGTVALSRIPPATRQQLGLAARGLLVQEATAGAQRAGIRAGSRTVTLGGEQVRLGGDVIVAVDGHPVTLEGELRGYIENQKRPGDTITLTVLRDGRRQDVTVTLSERPSR